MDIILWCRWFLSIFGFDSVSDAHLTPESFQRFIYFIQIGQFVLRRRVCLHHWEVVQYFTDLDISLWFRWFFSISGFDSVSGAHSSPESFQRFIYFFRLDTLCLADVYVGIIASSVVIHWIEHNSMMQMFSFNFGFWFGVRRSFPSRISPEIHLLYSDWTLRSYETCMMGSLGSSVVLHWFDISLWCRWFLSNFGFWFGFSRSFPSRISPEIHLFYSDWTLRSYEMCMMGSLGSSVVIHWFDISLWCRWFLSNFGIWFGFCSSFQSRISPEIQLFYLDWTLCA